MPNNIVIHGYLVLEATEHYTSGQVYRAKLERATTRPPKLTDGQVAVRVSIDLPASVFGPVAIAHIAVPEDAVIVPEAEVVVG